MPKPAPSDSQSGSARRWVSVDAILATTPAPLAPKNGSYGSDEPKGGDDAGGGCDGGCGGCCCCCCCCCGGEPESPPPVRVITPSVGLAARWESLVDPTDLDAGVQAVRAELRWRARGGPGLLVEIEARTEDSDGGPQGRYPSWTAIGLDQSPVDIVTVLIERSMGTTVRLRAKARETDGTLGYSEVLTLRFND